MAFPQSWSEHSILLSVVAAIGFSAAMGFFTFRNQFPVAGRVSLATSNYCSIILTGESPDSSSYGSLSRHGKRGCETSCPERCECRDCCSQCRESQGGS